MPKTSDVFNRTNIFIGIVGFIITVVATILVDLKLSIPLEWAIVFALALYIGLLGIAYISQAQSFHSKILGPLRRYLQFCLSPIVIENWKATIKIDEEGTGTIVHDFKGHINFEQNKWIIVGIVADEPQPDSQSFAIKVTNVDTGQEIDAEPIIDCPRYKKYKICFDKTLVRGDHFHYKVEYALTGSFYLGKDDHYGQDATHFEKKIDIRVEFPQSVHLTKVESDILTAQGDHWGKHKQPEWGDNWINWTIERAAMSNKHVLLWRTKHKAKRNVNV